MTTNAKPLSNLPLLKVKAIDNDANENGIANYYIQHDPTNQFIIDKENGEIFVKPEVNLF